MFTSRQLRALLIPLMIEQVLTSLMGTVDTMMVANAGSAAISAVSLVDSVNVLVIFVFSAMATGGTIICAQYLGRKEPEKANAAGRQLMLSVTAIAIAITAALVLLRGPLLRAIFGQVEPDVMRDALIYLLITALSYPFIALYNAGAALFRVDGNSRLPLLVSTASNLVNIAGNALLIFGFGMGAAGVALATLFSRILCAVVLLLFLRRPDHTIVVRDYLSIRPDGAMIRSILRVGIPSGIESGMFQFGKLAIQSSISTLGTTAIAAHALAASIELLTSNAQMGLGNGLMTVVGRCMGAGRIDEARHYIRRITVYAEVLTIVISALFALLVRPITVLAGLETAAAELCIHMVYVISVYKIFPWTLAYIPAFGMRAAGDVRFSMIASSCVMWICRVVATTVMIRVLHWGIMSAWYGMFLDWTVKGTIFYLRFRSGKWAQHSVLENA